AWLDGLSPRENRDIPPLNYSRAGMLAERCPELDIVLNGGLCSADDVAGATQGRQFAGVMIGRAAYKTPLVLADMASQIQGTEPASLLVLGEIMTGYARAQMADGTPLHAITRHMLGLAAGMKGAKQFRRRLGEEARVQNADPALIMDTIEQLVAVNEKSVA
ncbi:MAG: tRNA-dihydrouridine synthase, partial [Candidatus Puniceispirillaceae bacterium]